MAAKKMDNLNKLLASDERTVHQAKFKSNAGALNPENTVQVRKSVSLECSPLTTC